MPRKVPLYRVGAQLILTPFPLHNYEPEINQQFSICQRKRKDFFNQMRSNWNLGEGCGHLGDFFQLQRNQFANILGYKQEYNSSLGERREKNLIPHFHNS